MVCFWMSGEGDLAQRKVYQATQTFLSLCSLARAVAALVADTIPTGLKDESSI